MLKTPAKFQFNLLDQNGSNIGSSGVLGSLGFSENYCGKVTDSDELVDSIRNAFNGKKLTERQSCLIRSFLIEWLAGKSRKLGPVLNFAVELPESTLFLAQVGFLDRTANKVASGVLLVAGVAIFLDATWDMILTDLASLSGPETVGFIASQVACEAALLAIPDKVFSRIDKTFGKPGEPLPRSQFTPEPIESMLRLCKFRALIDHCDCDDGLQSYAISQIDLRIAALFIANSRQIEGLTLSGASEASAAVAATAAISLGLNSLPETEEILKSLQTSIAMIDCEVRKHEATRTLSAILATMGDDLTSIERQLNRQLASATATEAVDLLATPVELSFRLMSLVAGTMETAAPRGHFKTVFGTLKNGFQIAQKSTDAAPNLLASAIDSGISAESWTRKTISNLWPFPKSPREPTGS